jgi:4-diphosphocytidyl-2-C-methyl-D-erythritol kinase
MLQLAINSYAKVNLYLAVLNKRKDNYHNIKTLFERISLHDKIILKSRPDKKIKIICQDPLVPQGNANLCYRSAMVLQERFNIKEGLDIKIIKRIPVGSGLGGGSSNAASVLSGLNKFWRLNLPLKRLAKLGGCVGSDVPFFVYNTSFAKGCGRGENIKPLRGLKSLCLWHILVVPKIAVSTPLIYRKWDTYSRLTRVEPDVKLLILALRRGDILEAGKYLFNSLEKVTENEHPVVRRIKEKLAKLGLKSILMSGSGPAVFGIVSSRKEAVTLNRRLSKGNSPWRIFVTRTV